MIRKVSIGTILLAAVLYAPAQELESTLTATPVMAPPKASISRTFEDLGSPRQALKLSGVQASYSFSIPISPREKLAGGTIKIETTNSTSLIQRRSELSVSVNGQIMGQYQLDPVRTRALHEIDISADLLKPGYNDVRVSVIQHYTDDCENPTSPELWTLIDGKRSSVTLNFSGTVANPGPRLTQLSTAFDRRGWMSRRLAVVSGSDSLTEGELTAAGLVVQGLNLRLDYRPLGVDVMALAKASANNGTLSHFPGLADNVFDDRDVLLVGKRSELSRYLSQDLYSMVSGPYVGIFPANGGESVVIVVSGATDEEVALAAKSLANLDYRFSDLVMERVTPVALPGAKLLLDTTPQTFDKLNFHTVTLSANSEQAAYVEFRAPGHFAARKDDFATLNLHLSYSAGLRQGSNLDVFLNDTFIRSIALDSQEGKEILSGMVKVPAQAIKPGYNTISFVPRALPFAAKCSREGVASVTIFDDSKIELPSPTLTARAPDLERYSRSFWPQNPVMTVMLTSNKTEVVAAYLELMGLMAQRNRTALDVHATYTMPVEGDVTIVGPFERLPDPVITVWPLAKYQWAAAGTNMGVLQTVENKRVLTGFFAQDARTLSAGIELLRSKGFWRGLAGNAAIIDTREQSMHVDGVSPAEQEGISRVSLPADWRILFAVVAAGVAMVALFIAFGVRRFLKPRGKPAAGATPGNVEPTIQATKSSSD